MKTYVYTECPDEQYYRALLYLEKKKKLDSLNIVDSRIFYLLALKLLKRKTISFKRIIDSFFGPLRLLFKQNIVLCFAPYSINVGYMLLLKLLRKNLIYNNSWPYWSTKRYIHKPFFNKWLWRLFLKNTKTIVPTESAKKELLKYKARPFLIPHPVDTDLFRPLPKKNKKVRILYIGRLIKEKGLLELVKIAKKFNKNQTEFLFIGSGGLGEFLKKQTLPIKYLGEIRDRKKIAELSSNSDIFVLNSYSTDQWEEWFGIVIVEAMASGLAVIATDCIGPREIIEDGVSGFVIKQKNNKQLEEKLRILIGNKKLIQKMGKEGRKKALTNYDIKKVAKKWLDVLTYA